MTEMHAPTSEGTGVDTVSIGLVASDLDGTLLRHDGTISDRTRAMLGELRVRGIVFVLVTARPPRTARLVAEHLGVTGLAICCNGALVYDLAMERVVRHAPLAPEIVWRVVVALRTAVPGLVFACEQEMRFGYEPAWASARPSAQREENAVVCEDILSLANVPATKLMAFHPEMSPEHLFALVRTVAGEGVLVTSSGAPFVEMSAAGVHKAAALAQVCADLGIARGDVIAFGDMPNDLPMLEWAGRGVAVANAHPEVLAAADAHTESNEEDGVARELSRLLGLRLASQVLSRDGDGGC